MCAYICIYLCIIRNKYTIVCKAWVIQRFKNRHSGLCTVYIFIQEEKNRAYEVENAHKL